MKMNYNKISIDLKTVVEYDNVLNVWRCESW